ncbi:response regulator transcription factor [Fusibacter sp. JL216-2]|uniref:response regulator transcription factor n=1 Tax=Fusibacter sp. JL216-2 TaxID=3071453 RepID=UPI003D346117
MLNKIPEGYFTSSMSVLIYAALSFACGNNRGLILMIEKVIVENFQSSDEEVFYYAIKAISSTSQDVGLRIDLVKKALERVDSDTSAMILAYAHLVYAQLLTTACDYIKAEIEYKYAVKKFGQSKAYFLETMTFTNYAIFNNLKGKHKKVIRESRQFLNEKGTIFENFNKYNCMVEMVLGAAYKNIGKVAIAKKTLESAMRDIYKLELVHMYAYPFYELFECLIIMHSNDEIMKHVETFTQAVSQLNDENISLFIHYTDIYLALKYDKIPEKSDIEAFEIACSYANDSGMINYLELALELKLLNLSDLFNIDDLRKKYERSNYMELKLESAKCSALFLKWYDANGFIDEAKAYCLELLEKCLDIGNVFLLIKYKTLIRKYIKYIPEKVATDVDELYPAFNGDLINKGISNPYDLTERELDVLSLISEGMSNKDVAMKLYISVGTVKWHLNNLYGKMNVKSRYEAIVIAKEKGILNNKLK